MTLVIGHRGAAAARPPGNTLDAFRTAAALGADWVELDVRRTADGALAVHHDAHLPDGRPLVGTRSVDLPSWVPLLSAALEACAGMGVNIEIKNSPDDPDFDEARTVADDVVALLDGTDRSGFLVTSFDPRTLDRVRSLDPLVPCGLLALDLEDPGPAIDHASRHGWVSINPWAPWVDERFVGRCHAVGLQVFPWTVNDPEHLRALIALGVSGIITDEPDVLRRLVDGG
jgi:glycerophosphoryl diester phosphodiesterase